MLFLLLFSFLMARIQPDLIHLLFKDDKIFLGLNTNTFFTVISVSLLSSLFMIPLNLLIIFVATLFPFWPAVILSMIGSLIIAGLGYSMGVFFGKKLLERFFQRSALKFLRRVKKAGFTALLAARLLPISPSSLINLAAGNAKVGISKYVLATFCGVLPGILLICLWQEILVTFLANPNLIEGVELSFLALCVIYVLRFIRRRFEY